MDSRCALTAASSAARSRESAIVRSPVSRSDVAWRSSSASRRLGDACPRLLLDERRLEPLLLRAVCGVGGLEARQVGAHAGVLGLQAPGDAALLGERRARLLEIGGDRHAALVRRPRLRQRLVHVVRAPRLETLDRGLEIRPHLLLARGAARASPSTRSCSSCRSRASPRSRSAPASSRAIRAWSSATSAVRSAIVAAGARRGRARRPSAPPRARSSRRARCAAPRRGRCRPRLSRRIASLRSSTDASRAAASRARSRSAAASASVRSSTRSLVPRPCSSLACSWARSSGQPLDRRAQLLRLVVPRGQLGGQARVLREARGHLGAQVIALLDDARVVRDDARIVLRDPEQIRERLEHRRDPAPHCFDELPELAEGGARGRGCRSR
jgi:hypothetical protein